MLNPAHIPLWIKRNITASLLPQNSSVLNENLNNLITTPPGKFSHALLYVQTFVNMPALQSLSHCIATICLLICLPHQTRAPQGPSLFLILLCIPQHSTLQGIWHNANAQCLCVG